MRSILSYTATAPLREVPATKTSRKPMLALESTATRTDTESGDARMTRSTRIPGPRSRARACAVLGRFAPKIVSSCLAALVRSPFGDTPSATIAGVIRRSEEHTSELQSRLHLVCRLLLEKKK